MCVEQQYFSFFPFDINILCEWIALFDFLNLNNCVRHDDHRTFSNVVVIIVPLCHPSLIIAYMKVIAIFNGKVCVSLRKMRTSWNFNPPHRLLSIRDQKSSCFFKWECHVMSIQAQRLRFFDIYGFVYRFSYLISWKTHF